MKKEIHPDNYREVIYRDVGVDKSWKTRSTVQTDKTIVWEEDGNEYPLFDVAVSQYSHPFYTGEQRFVDSEGRIDKFRKKYQKKQ